MLRSKTPNTALPSILDEHVARDRELEARAGSTAAPTRPGADKTDKAEQWFNSSASRGAGSGPYVLKRYSTTSQIMLVAEPALLGAEKPAFETVVVRNMIAPTQLINIQRGKHEVAIDLSVRAGADDQGRTSA